MFTLFKYVIKIILDKLILYVKKKFKIFKEDIEDVIPVIIKKKYLKEFIWIISQFILP